MGNGMPIVPPIGAPLRVRVVGDTSENSYKSRVADLDDEFLYADVPVHQGTGREMDVHVDTTWVIEYAASENDVYQYCSRVLGLSYIPTPAVRLVHPLRGSDLVRIQRREYFRVSLDAQVKLTCLRTGESYVAQAIDISGGGLAVHTRDPVDIEYRDRVHVDVTLPHTGYRLQAPCQVVRVEAEGTGRTLSMQFVDIPERVRDQVVRYTFMRQRALRRRIDS
ncbi:flagellar brake protein [Alicyclobacillus acidocaldarius]|uniref:Type IV pilus assembly PilZ n=1 Tax=Alicyclobacillus acidocaldarius subsp. acidocaldarius (strain ATCC 27009 / DSM 446 / BCRC 14685 / JCM 5260 / KCTC 1825 / NBRC 15652 / NCIMB 11725 / NRRL B-14509 / 104-IA) TaxID=521098 RepID=C8WX97_ALIAD|nr:PilZ domain-containing protein [Alicyclobacillus acidocaldarius]ACV58719.1 type IV pilus assembly PilZ [Alicyclobacillus acidocaldarius subsp. acidocaldarius DSM 446]